MDDSLFSTAPAPDDSHLFSEEPAPPVQSWLESAARGALRNVPLAQQAAAAIAPVNPFSDKWTYSEELAHLTDAAEQGKAQNPKSYYSGAAAGTLAPLLIPGAGEVAMAARGAGAAGGALNAAAQSLSDVNLTKPTGRDVANTAMSAALGGVLGEMFGGSKAAPAIAEEAENAVAPAAASVAAPEAVPDAVKAVAPSAVPTPQVPPRFGTTQKPVAADFVNPQERASASMIAQGLGGTPRQQLKLYIGKDPVQVLNEIGTWMKTADNGKSIAGVLDRPGALLGKVQSIHDSAGKAIGDMIEKVSPGANVDGGALAFQLDKLLDETYDANAEHAILKLQTQLQKLETDGRLDFEALQKIKSSFGKQAKAAGHDMAGSSVKQAYGVLSQYMNDAVDQFGANIKEPGMLSDYTKAKIDYKNASNLLPLLRYQEAKELIGGPAGHTTMLGLLEKIAHQGSMALGATPPDQMVKNALLKAGTAMSPAAVVPGAEAAAAPAARAAVRPAIQNGLNQAAQLELANSLESKFKDRKK
jgi:hypothetical protein